MSKTKKLYTKLKFEKNSTLYGLTKLFQLSFARLWRGAGGHYLELIRGSLAVPHRAEESAETPTQEIVAGYWKETNSDNWNGDKILAGQLQTHFEKNQKKIFADTGSIK